jgi:hypothetical protein
MEPALERVTESWRKEDEMVPILMWLLGVPGLLIVLLLLLGVIHF